MSETAAPTLRSLFDACVDLTPDARAAFLAAHCRDAGLRARVENLLRADQDEQLPFARDAAEAARAIGVPDAGLVLPPGTRIGPFEILSVLGEGGSSTVFRAQRDSAGVRQPVALKILSRGVYSSDSQRQFRRERQALAQLTHPGIARLIEGGVTDAGVAYIALELVDGLAITAYARQWSIGLRERLLLFVQVCRAVEAAHRALIVHRDLKPSNVLVAAGGNVKLLDFGIAKLLESEDGEERTRLPMLTPAYAAPEQHANGSVTTATDVYALGVLLGELLTGQRLRSEQRASGAVPDDAASGVLPDTPAATRRALRGDLDNILRKAIDAAPERRYASAGALAEDVERQLEGKPVAAHPPSRWYRTRKFIQRHRAGVAMAAAFLLAIVAALGAAVWQAQVATQQARIARVHAQRAEAIQAFLADVFHANSANQRDPVKARQTTARELLDLGAKSIDKELADAPEAKLRLVQLFGGLYDDLYLYDSAVPLRRSEVELSRRLYGETSRETAAALLDLAGSVYPSSDSAPFAATLDETGAILDRLGDDTSALRGSLLRKLAVLHQDTNVPRAIDYAQRSVDVFEREQPPSPELAESLSNLGWLLDHAGRSREAIAVLQRAVDLVVARNTPGGPDLPRNLAYLSDAQQHALDLAGAERNARAALQGIQAVNGDEPADTPYFQMRLGKLLWRTGRAKAGIDLLTEAKTLVAKEGKSSDDPGQPMWVQFMRGQALAQGGEPAEGLEEIRAAVAACRKSEPDAVFLAQFLEAQAAALIDLSRYDDAQTALDEAQKIHATHGEGASTDAVMTHVLLQAHLALARGDNAGAQALVDGVPDTDALGWLGLERALLAADVELAQRHAAAAAQRAAHVRQRIEQAGLAHYLPLQLAQADLIGGRAERAQGHHETAQALLHSALALRQGALLPGSPRIAEARAALQEAL